MPARFDMLYFYRSETVMASAPDLTIEFAAAHKKITFGIGADVFAFLIEQLRIANRAVVPPIFLRFDLGRRQFRTIHGHSSEVGNRVCGALAPSACKLGCFFSVSLNF
jgi:hypothetical protein